MAAAMWERSGDENCGLELAARLLALHADRLSWTTISPPSFAVVLPEPRPLPQPAPRPVSIGPPVWMLAITRNVLTAGPPPLGDFGVGSA